MTTAARPTLAISQLELFTAVEAVKGRMGSNFFATQFQSHASKKQPRKKTQRRVAFFFPSVFDLVGRDLYKHTHIYIYLCIYLFIHSCILFIWSYMPPSMSTSAYNILGELMTLGGKSR